MPGCLVGCRVQTYSENKELGARDRFEGDPIPQPLHSPRDICVYLSRHLLAVVLVFIWSNGLALPSS
jgi:hypothetical protein